MAQITFKTHPPENYTGEAYATLPDTPTTIALPTGSQVVLYEHANFQGNTVVLSAHAGEATFDMADTVVTSPQSLRILRDITIIPGHIRDKQAMDAALDGWFQNSHAQIAKRMAWVDQSKFGCFVHWGVYALAGGEWKGRRIGYAEHVQRAMQINQADYKEHFIDKFNPVDFDADAWIRTVKDAGMKYFVITVKHHDGFHMGHSDVYPYDMRLTPFQRDPMAELKAACDKYDMPFGFYYSHAFDWEHPDAAGNDWEYTNGGGDKFLFEGKKGRWFDEHPELVPRTAKYYVDTKCIPQILELITKYQPALLWFDTPHKLPFSENLRILQAIREADPAIVVNGRLARNQLFTSCADYVNTGDRAAEIFPTPGYWETIPTTNESYGYSRVDKSHKPPEHFIQLLVKVAARGGNVLMNLGPTEHGTIDAVDKDILQGIGDWLKANGDSIYGTTRSPLPVQTFGETTRKGNRLFLHLFEEAEGTITLGGMITPLDHVYLLTNGQKTSLITKRVTYFDTVITLPGKLPPHTVLVAEFTGELLVGGGRLISGEKTEYLRAFDASHVPQELGRGDGKRGNDVVDGFKNTDEAIIWQVRAHEKKAYTLKVHYRTPPDCKGAYSIYVNDTRHEQELPQDQPGAICEDAFDVVIEGARDIVFRPARIEGTFAQLFGITLIPRAAQEATIHIEEDTTDTGDKG